MTLYENLVARCNDFLFKHMYPFGNLPVASEQHRDLVRTFFAGAFELLMIQEDRIKVAELIPYYRKMAKEDWFPGEELTGPTGIGRHIETGIALASRKKILIVGKPESIFHHMENVYHVEEVMKGIEFIRSLS